MTNLAVITLAKVLLLVWFLQGLSVYAQHGSGSPLPSIGVVGQKIEATIKNRRCRGVRLLEVAPRGSAHACGLRTNDIILSINERVVASPENLRGILELESGKIIRVVFARPRSSQFELKRIPARWYFQDQLETQSRPVDEKKQMQELEAFAYSLIDRDRLAHGIKAPLKRSKKLSEFAMQYAQDMRQDEFFSHSDSRGRDLRTRAAQACVGQVSENLAFQRGNNPKFLIQQCQLNFMSEPPEQENHRANILDSQNKSVGVGIAFLKEGGVLLVQEFSHFDVP